MELFDILKSFFSDKAWKEVSKVDKSRNFFMINRIMSISFPLQGNAFNNTKIEPAHVIDYWRKSLTVKYKTTPQWFFTKTKKKEKTDIFIPSEEVSSFIRSRFDISNREILELSKYFPKEFKEFCKLVEEQIA
jgi:hypothetical protein